MDLVERLTTAGPKRILALDGGGIRGCITLGFLQHLEALLRRRQADPTLVLRDYFDLIGGTSTGAIIGGLLALGHDVKEIRKIYFARFSRALGRINLKVWHAVYDSKPMVSMLDDLFGELALGDPSLTTGLCIFTKRADTGSTWPILNHPGGTFFEDNKSIPLKQAIRASGAAPAAFVPQVLDIGNGQTGAFVDGGISMANNPALQLFLVATLRGFPFRWPVGEDRLLLVSVGTGVWNKVSRVRDVEEAKAWDWATEVPDMLIEDSSWQAQLLLQYLSRSATPWTIDLEVGDLSEDLLTPQPALTYLRYNVWLEEAGLVELGLESMSPKVKSLRDPIAGANAAALHEIGCFGAKRQMHEEHFPAAFDSKPSSTSQVDGH